MKVILINAKDRTVSTEEFKKITLADYYTMLDCDCIDIVTRYVNGKPHSFIVDDNGLLKHKPILSGTSITDNNIFFVGNIVICDFNDKGKEIGLTDDEIASLQTRIKFFKDKNGIDFPIIFLD